MTSLVSASRSPNRVRICCSQSGRPTETAKPLRHVSAYSSSAKAVKAKYQRALSKESVACQVVMMWGLVSRHCQSKTSWTCSQSAPQAQKETQPAWSNLLEKSVNSEFATPVALSARNATKCALGSEIKSGSDSRSGSASMNNSRCELSQWPTRTIDTDAKTLSKFRTDSKPLGEAGLKHGSDGDHREHGGRTASTALHRRQSTLQFRSRESLRGSGRRKRGKTGPASFTIVKSFPF